MTRAESLRRLKSAVRRDLEWLLNAREPVQPPPEGAAQLEKSMYCFGLPDLCSMNLGSPKNRDDLARLMETMIAIFEPRLDRYEGFFSAIRAWSIAPTPLRDRRVAGHRSDAGACQLRYPAGCQRRRVSRQR